MAPRSFHLSPELHDYVIAHGTPPDPILEQLKARTQEAAGDFAGMQIGADQAAFMTTLVYVELDPTTPLDELTRLVAAEQNCCQFLRFAITVDTRGVALEVRGPDDALSIIEALFGAS